MDATTAGAQGLTVTAGTGAVTFGGAVGDDRAGEPGGDQPGTTTLGGNVSTDGPQTYNSAVTLAAATVTLNSNVKHGERDDRSGWPGHRRHRNLVLTSGTGDQTLSGDHDDRRT